MVHTSSPFIALIITKILLSYILFPLSTSRETFQFRLIAFLRVDFCHQLKIKKPHYELRHLATFRAVRCNLLD